MSQASNSIISGDNADLKYKKALKEISKLMQANKILRQNSQKGSHQLKQKIDELSVRYEDLEKESEILRKEKETLSHYLDEIQKQRNNLERENGYLNEVLAEQGSKLKKYELEGDQRAIASLIRTYQQKQALMNKNRAQQDQVIAKLKTTIDRLQTDILELKVELEEQDEKYNRTSMEIDRYRELNQALMTQNQRILMDHGQKQSNLPEKQRQLQFLTNEFRAQLSILKATSEDNGDRESANRYSKNIELAYTEKNNIDLQYAKLRDAYQQAMQREKYFYELQQKLKTANLRAEHAVEEANMLKSKIVVLQAKQFLDEAGDEDYGQKQFQQRIAMMINEHDPLLSVKNGDDTSHFRILKSFIVQLQDKIYRINSSKIQTTKKYKSLKSKFFKNAKQLSILQEQNKLYKGKIEGYQRLTQKLQFQLEKSISCHEQQITRMTITSNNILNKKNDDYRATIAMLNSQIQMNQDKLQRNDKNLKQEIQTLKLELETLRIKYRESSEKSNKEGEFIQLYKKKNQQLNSKSTKLEEDLAEVSENAIKWQQLFKEEKIKNEGLITQKQKLLSQNKQLVEELDRKSQSFNQSIRVKESASDFELKKLRSQNHSLREQLDYTSRELHTLQRELDDRRAVQQSEVDQLKRITNKNIQLQEKINQLKRRIRDLQDQNSTLKLKGQKYNDSFEKSNRLEEQLLQKNDKLNDLLREKLSLQSQLKSITNQYNNERKHNEDVKKQISQLKLKSMDSTHQIKKQLENKIIQGKKTIQSLNQQIAQLSSELRDQKSKNSRITNQLSNIKSERTRIQQNLDQNRKKDYQAENTIGSLKLQISSLTMENEKWQNQIKNNQLTINNLNEEIQTIQKKVYSLNQEISNYKIKIETFESNKSDTSRQLNSMKFVFSESESYSLKMKGQTNLKWDEQSFYNNISDLLNRIRKIGKLYGVVFENASPAIYAASLDSSRGGSGINTAKVTQYQYVTRNVSSTIKDQDYAIKPIQGKKSYNINVGGDDTYDFFKGYSGGDGAVISSRNGGIGSQITNKDLYGGFGGANQTYKVDYSYSNTVVNNNQQPKTYKEQWSYNYTPEGSGLAGINVLRQQ